MGVYAAGEIGGKKLKGGGKLNEVRENWLLLRGRCYKAVVMMGVEVESSCCE